MPWTLWDVLVDLLGIEVWAYIAEPDRGRRKWTGKRVEQAAVYANRQRIADNRGPQLLRRRDALVERTFAHAYETGTLRAIVHARKTERAEEAVTSGGVQLGAAPPKDESARGRREQRGTLWSICCFVLL